MENQNTTHDNKETNQNQVNNFLIPARKKLYRSPYNSIVLGVASGIAEYLNISPLFIRVLFVFTALLGGWGIIAYVISLFLIPEHPSIKIKGKFARLNSPSFLGFVLVIIGLYNWIPPFGIFRYLDAYNYSDSILFGLAGIALGGFILIKGKVNHETKPNRPKKLYRSKDERRLLGVCKGFAVYLDADVNIIRMLLIFLSFVTLGLTAILYLVIGYFIPNEISEVVVNE